MNPFTGESTDSTATQEKPRGLNGLLLAALLLFIFAQNNLDHIYHDLYSGDPDYLWTTVIGLLCVIAAALLSDLTRQPRLISIMGLGLTLALSLLCQFSNVMSGYTLCILLNLGTSMSMYPLLKRVTTNTAFFGREQCIILLAMTGTYLFSYAFRQLSFNLYSSYRSDTPVSFVLNIITLLPAFVLVLSDHEQETEPQPYSRFLQRHPGFWQRFFIPFVLAGLTLTWGMLQVNRLFVFHRYIDSDYSLTLPAFIAALVSMGVLALLVLGFSIKNPVVYLCTSGGLLVLLLCLPLLLDGEQTENYRWLFLVFTRVAGTLSSVGLTMWIFRYTDFPFLTLLLVAANTLDHLSFFLCDYLGLKLYHSLTPSL